MHRLRAILKRCIAYGLYYSGALWVYRRVVLRNRAIVLMYHRVLPAAADSFSSSGIVVSPRRVRREHAVPPQALQTVVCRASSSRASTVADSRLAHASSRSTMAGRTMRQHALPILQSLGVPAVLFVATGYVGTGNTFWQERMTRQLFALNRDPGVGRSTLAEIGIADAFDASDDEEARHDVRSFVDRLKSSTTAEIERVAAVVSTACRQIGLADDELGDDLFLDWNALNRMASTGLVTIGSHAHSHVPLPRLGREARNGRPAAVSPRNRAPWTPRSFDLRLSKRRLRHDQPGLPRGCRTEDRVHDRARICQTWRRSPSPSASEYPRRCRVDDTGVPVPNTRDLLTVRRTELPDAVVP